jgi:phage-related protein (TIGR01555 family)
MNEEAIKSEQDFTFKIDGYENALTGVGMSGVDPKKSTRHRASRQLTDTENGEMWRHNGLGSRIVKLPLQDAFREGFKVAGDDDGEIFAYLKEKKLWNKFKECARWADVYGGCIIVLGIKDGGEFDDAVDENDISDISFAHVFDKGQVNVYRIDEDVQSDNFGLPEIYEVSPLTGGEHFTVHHSRVIRIDGEILPEREWQRNSYWHDSVFQRGYKEIERLCTGHVSASRALDNLYIYVMKMRGLAQQIAQGNESKVVTRLNQLALTLDMLNMLGVDENESVERNSITLTGVKDILEKLGEAISMIYGIPMSLLTGQAPNGLSDSDESGMTFYYAKVANKQEEQLTDPLHMLIRYVMLSDSGPTNGTELDKWVIEWNKIERQSETEIVANRKTQAEVDKIYAQEIQPPVVASSEVRESRFGGIEQSLDTNISAENNPPTAEELASAAREAGEE